MRKTKALGFVFLMCLTSCPAGNQSPSSGDGGTSEAGVSAFSVVIVHGKLYSEVRGADAVAIAGSQIMQVGASADLGKQCVGSCQLVDAAGGFVMPGFHDAHVHPFAAGRQSDELKVRSSSVSRIQAA